MPTKRFSTMSTRPTPCLPPSLFSVFITWSGVSFFPFTAVQSPFTKSSSTYSALSGASSGSTESVVKYSRFFFGSKLSYHGSSRMPAS